MFDVAGWIKKGLCLGGVVLGVAFFFVVSSDAGGIGSYSADQVFIDPEGNVRGAGKLFVAPEKARMEGIGSPTKGNMIVIVRQDLKVHWVLSPAKKAYYERPLNEEELQATMKNTFKRGGEEKLGSEKVSGYMCTKKRVTITTEFMGRKRKNKSIVWTSDKFDMPLRTQGSDGSMTEIRNIKTGRQPAGLFEIPPEYARVDGMFQLFAPSAEDDEALEPATRSPRRIRRGDIPEEVLKRLPKDFKLPYDDEE